MLHQYLIKKAKALCVNFLSSVLKKEIMNLLFMLKTKVTLKLVVDINN